MFLVHGIIVAKVGQSDREPKTSICSSVLTILFYDLSGQPAFCAEEEDKFF